MKIASSLFSIKSGLSSEGLGGVSVFFPAGHFSTFSFYSNIALVHEPKPNKRIIMLFLMLE